MREKLITKVISAILGIVPYLISRLIPRSGNIWVFGAWFGHRYADNSRYVFDYVSANDPGIRAVWISRERKIVKELREAGREAYLSGSWLGYWMCCRASLAFFTCGGILDISAVGLSRAKKVQLWHGTPLKKIGLDDHIGCNPPRPAAIRALKFLWGIIFPFAREHWDLVISASPIVSERLITAFGLNPSEAKVTGYPRGDIVLSATPERIPIVESVKNKWNAARIVAYIPTYRGDGLHDFDFFAGLDATILNDCLSKYNAVMLVKMHYFHEHAELPEGIDFESCRIHWLSGDELTDVNRLLPYTDVLITDYSSVYFEYLLLNRPILFAPFDKERYLSKDRELYDDYDSATPGPKCTNWDELICELGRVLGGRDDYQEVRAVANQRYNTFTDTANCQRVVETARRLLDH